MKGAEKEVESLERKAREAAGLPADVEDGSALPPITLLSYRDMQRTLRKKQRKEKEEKKKELERKVEETEAEMKQIQDHLKALSRDGPDEYKENRLRNGIFARKQPGEEESNHAPVEEPQHHVDESKGAIGPEGDFVEFPEYDGSEEPKQAKKAFTHFCIGHRKEVKATLDPENRRDKAMVNDILRERWLELPDEEKRTWRAWAAWDLKRFTRDQSIFEKAQQESASPGHAASSDIHIPKKRQVSAGGDGDAALAHVPKKKKRQ